MKKKYEVVEFNSSLASATSNLIQGRPDLWEVFSTHSTMKSADRAARKLQAQSSDRVAIRIIGERHPIYDRYYNVILAQEREQERWKV